MKTEYTTLTTIAEKVIQQVDKLDDTLQDIRIILARQEENIAHHIRRTDLLEENLDLLRREIEPVKTHVEFVNRLAKVFSSAIAIAGTITAIGLGLYRLTHPG